MNTCDTCKHWAQEDEDGQCRAPFLMSLDDVLSGQHPTKDEAIADYDDEDRPAFCTGPKFGCVHWEAI